MSTRMLLASSIAMLSMAVSAAPTTYTQIVPGSNGPVTVEVRVENGDFQMVSVLPPMTVPTLTTEMNATNHAELDSLTTNAIDMATLRNALTIAIERAAAQEPDPGFVPGTYRSTLVGEHGEVAIEFTIGPRGVGEIKVLDSP